MQCRVRASRNDRIVRDHQDGFAVLAHKLINQRHDLVRALAVQVAGGLIAKQESRVRDNGASDSDALLLSAGKLARVVMHAIGQIDDAERGLHVLAALRFRELGQQQWKLDVLIGGEHGNQVVHLKYETNVASAPLRKLARGHVRDFVAVNSDAAGRGHVEPAQELAQRGLAGAAGAHESHEVTLVDVEIEALQHLNFLAAAAVGLVQTANFDQAGRTTISIDSYHALLLTD